MVSINQDKQEIFRARGLKETKEWKKAVFIRDNYTCRLCNDTVPLVKVIAHHIKSFNAFPELRCNIDNGMTLCTGCHIFIHRFERLKEVLKEIGLSPIEIEKDLAEDLNNDFEYQYNMWFRKFFNDYRYEKYLEEWNKERTRWEKTCGIRSEVKLDAAEWELLIDWMADALKAVNDNDIRIIKTSMEKQLKE